MNWFTTDYVASKSPEVKATKLSIHGGCDHCMEDPSVMHAIQYENDSFGREGYCVCLACFEESKKHEEEEEVICCDCKGVFPTKNARPWRWYDFYAPQGDEPIHVCDSCREKITHRLRVWQDNRDYAEETGHSEFREPRPVPREGVDYFPEVQVAAVVEVQEPTANAQRMIALLTDLEVDGEIVIDRVADDSLPVRVTRTPDGYSGFARNGDMKANHVDLTEFCKILDVGWF